LPGDRIVLNTGVLEIRVDRSGFAERPTFQPELIDDLPDVPVLPETLLSMELRAREYSVDLHEMAQVILSDIGATIQILRLAAGEYGTSDDRPVRIEDCISSLGLQACLKAAARLTVSSQSCNRAVSETWAHCREAAQYSKTIAEAMAGVHPEDAYWAGLFHALPLFPGILGWNCREFGLKDDASAGLRMAERWHLPRCVRELFREMHQPGHGSHWTGIVSQAHEMARRSSIDCPLYDTLIPRLHKRA